MEEHQTRRPRRKFSDEFKRDAVEIVRTSDRSIAEVARELGIYDSSLGSWVRQDRVNRGEREGVSSNDLYLSFVEDLASRRILGLSMASHLRAELVGDALTEAIGTRGGDVTGVVFHSDRGTQLTSDQFAELCASHRVSQSVGRTGVCWDNAPGESFLATLKKELVHRRVFKTRAEARLAIRHWIEAWYNRRRLHSKLGYLSPIEWENHYRHTTETLAA
jgi:transposase InsO family protein